MSSGRRPVPARMLRRRIMEIWRTEGAQGQKILQHRALLSHQLPSDRILSILLLPALMTAGILLVHKQILLLWSSVIDAGIRFTQTPAQLGWTQSLGGLRLQANMIWLDMDAGAPSPGQWWMCAAVTFVAALISLRLPARLLPIAYVLRVHAIVIAASLAYFNLMPNSFTYSLSDHIAMLMLMVFVLAMLIPWVFAMTYNILGFSFRQKAWLSVLGVGFLVLFAPFQAFSHALVLHHGSLLYQPMLFLLMGMFPPMMAMVALYSWAMTWPRAAT